MPKEKLPDVKKFRVSIDIYLEAEEGIPTPNDAEKVIRDAVASIFTSGNKDTHITLVGHANIEAEAW